MSLTKKEKKEIGMMFIYILLGCIMGYAIGYHSSYEAKVNKIYKYIQYLNEDVYLGLNEDKQLCVIDDNRRVCRVFQDDYEFFNWFETCRLNNTK